MKVTVHLNLIKVRARDAGKPGNSDVWSICDTKSGKVIMTAERVGLRNVTTKYWAGGIALIQANGGSKRRVVAWLKGELIDYVAPAADARQVTYNPFRSSVFTYRDSGEEFRSASTLMFGADDQYPRVAS